MRCVLAGILLLIAPMVQAGEPKLAGSWKIVAIEKGEPNPLFLMRIDDKAGKLSATLIPFEKMPSGTVEDLRTDGKLLTFKLHLENKAVIPFEGKLPAGAGKNIQGSLGNAPRLFASYLEPSTAKNLYEVEIENVRKAPQDPRVPQRVLALLARAKAEKVPAKEVLEWADLSLQSSQAGGPRWHTEMSGRLFDALAGEYPDVAASMGKSFEASLGPKSPLTTRLRILDTFAVALKSSGRKDEARKLEARIEGLEDPSYTEYTKSAIEFPIKKFAGRKTGSTRRVLVELFTGIQCPPCVAADLAFDALEQTYTSAEVVLLQYHLHIPGPDPLTNADTDERQKYYKEEVEGAPCILFNGKVGAEGGGGVAQAGGKYKEYRAVIEPLLEKGTLIRLTAKAVRKGNKIDVDAKVKTIGKVGDKTRMRLALVEDWVRYRTPTGLSYLHRVVRSLPGGAKGVALEKSAGTIATSVDLDKLRQTIHKYLDGEGPFPSVARPLRLRHLHLVAFVQDDATKEVLQAIDVPVTEE